MENIITETKMAETFTAMAARIAAMPTTREQANFPDNNIVVAIGTNMLGQYRVSRSCVYENRAHNLALVSYIRDFDTLDSAENFYLDALDMRFFPDFEFEQRMQKSGTQLRRCNTFIGKQY